MAQQARQQQTQQVAVRFQKPAMFGGTDSAWRVICDLYSAAETPEAVMGVIEYCSVRKLDPFKKPVHIVPMWNSRLKRKVQTILQGINEIEITATRTGKWAGMDGPQWGPPVQRTFRGTVENNDGSTRQVEVTMTYPEWCSVTVYRLLGKERVAFTEQLFWEESYGTAGFRSAVPNERWQKAPRQMIHKCCKAAVLRAAFPEEASDLTAEEMEGKETEGGFTTTIDGHAEPPPVTTVTDLDRQADATYGTTKTVDSGDADADPFAPLEEKDSRVWLRNLEELCKAAGTLDDVATIAGHHSVVRALKSAPVAIKGLVNDFFKKAHERLVPGAPPPGEDPPPAGEWPDDPIAELVAEIDAMSADELDGLPSNKAWQAKIRMLIPPDIDRLDELDEAITLRRAALKGATP